MYNLPSISEPLDQLQAFLRKEPDAQIKRRLHMLVLFKSGEAQSRAAAARHLAVHRNTISGWLSDYQEGGVKALRQIGKPGPEPGQESIPPEAMAALQELLSEPEGFGSYTEIQHWLFEEFNVEVPYSTLHGIVRYRLGAKPKVPRPSHAKKTAKSR